ncbi:chorismate mutase [Roseomonas sp. NAR14]|uniref:chorismate mutase n=1 Tax=Roseomonas acroporae TaxID=2937791 RepID=A0A9X1Y7Q8_9PROT|nr:chorismate mutase [Roseomonas acroporae]MCK8785514.1 chorismate mutase [Roseomonas acroporae]
MTLNNMPAGPDPVPATLHAPAPQEPAGDALAALRTEIDALDDALQDLLRRRAEAVARLAESRAKAGGPALRPAREAKILRRLLARHAGPLPAAALVRLWREIFAATTAMQAPFAVAVFSQGEDQLRLAREHFGVSTPLRHHPTAARALGAVTAGEAQVAVLPVPDEGAPEADWWTRLDSLRLQVVACLPFWLPRGEERGAAAFAVTAGTAEPTGRDRSLLSVEAMGEHSRAHIAQALAAAGLAPRRLLLHRGPPGAAVPPRALAEVDGFVAADDPRLAAATFARIQPIGAYAVPEGVPEGAPAGAR